MQLKECVRIPQRYEHCTLDEYVPSTASQARALSEARRFVSRFPRVDKGLFFFGGRGTGKTHLAVGILLELLQRFQGDLLFFDFQSLGEPGWQMVQRFPGDNPDLPRLKTASLLVLDDFAPGCASVETLSLVQEILSARLRCGRVTIFTAGRQEQRKTPREHVPQEDSCIRPMPMVFHPRLSAQLMGNTKMILVNGANFRTHLRVVSPLF